MSKIRFVILFSLVTAVATAETEGLPDLVSDDVRNTAKKAEQAIADNDFQLALALYKGALYSDGITIAIDERTMDSLDQKDAVVFAIETWSKELSGDFPLKLVENNGDADILLSFVNTIDSQDVDTLGLIQVRKNYRWNSTVHEVSYKGTIQIVRKARGGPLTQAETLDVVMHEMGHLLGLGDVAKPGVLMGPLKRGKPLLSPTVNETNDVLELRAMLRQKIEEVQAMTKID